MPTLTTFKNTISGSTMQMDSVTASLSGTASYSLYGLTSSYALNVSGSWASASYTSPSQSVAGFDINGRAILITPTQDNLYLAKRGSTISWVPIETKFSAVYFVDEQQAFEAVSQSVNYAAALGVDTTEEVQSDTSRLTEIVLITINDVNFDSQQVVMSLSESMVSSFFRETLDRQDPVIDKTGSMNLTNVIAETIEYGDSFIDKTGSMNLTNVIAETIEYTDFFINKSGSMIPSNQFIETIEYIDGIIYVTGSMQPIFTATPFTTASI